LETIVVGKQKAEAKPVQTIAITSQRDVTPPKVTQWLKDQVARPEANALLVKLLGVELNVAALLGVGLVKRLRVVMDEHIL